MKDNDAKIHNISGSNTKESWRLKKYDYPTITIMGEEFYDRALGKVRTIYYFAMVRYSPDGTEHACIDKSLPIDKKMRGVDDKEMMKDFNKTNTATDLMRSKLKTIVY